MSSNKKELEILAENVKSHRLKRAWTQEHLAEICALNVRTIQRVEKLGQASLETKKALASAFNIPVDILSKKEQLESHSEVSPNNNKKSFLKSRLHSFAKNLCTLILASFGVYMVNTVFYPGQDWQYHWIAVWGVAILVIEARAFILHKFNLQ
ncbi:helix-turn-helix transcriptional regulator [Vibrio sp. S4M6]|uniref:helix-turn-helix domain-containing protein n=1 Tax=Vibrio sinus TaxID=2946865 RepID=UPI00202A30D4|nr:helix-turn-helix transcriptional regulator [Vibrio sinus]MCL9783414.1 helix-turn-helix transcriptional regulator [Vibrio sinus]